MIHFNFIVTSIKLNTEKQILERQILSPCMMYIPVPNKRLKRRQS